MEENNQLNPNINIELQNIIYDPTIIRFSDSYFDN